MTFFRSASGISNRALFSGKDISVFVEQDPDHAHSGALDVAHWREFFESSFPDLSFVVVPLGGKTPVVEMARKIVEEDILNAFCALDSDYDEHFGEKIQDDRVFYTFGYGVESDTLNRRSLRRALRACAPGAENVDDSAEQLWASILSTANSCKWLIALDALAVARGGAGFNRRAPKADLEASRTELPVQVKRAQVRRKALASKQNPIVRTLVDRAPCHWTNIPSHAYFEICYSTFVRHIKVHNIKNYAEDAFISLIVAVFGGNFFDCLDEDAELHYQALAGRNLASYVG